MKEFKHIKVNRELTYFHDDFYSDKDVEIPKFPFDGLFGDFRLFNGLPLEIVDMFVGELISLMQWLKDSHKIYKSYWKTQSPRPQNIEVYLLKHKASEIRKILERDLSDWKHRYASRYIIGRIIDGKYVDRDALAMLTYLFKLQNEEK